MIVRNAAMAARRWSRDGDEVAGGEVTRKASRGGGKVLEDG